MNKDKTTAQYGSVSVVVPCFNEELVLSELHRRLTEVCTQAPISAYEIIYINDGSSDQTAAMLAALHHSDPSVTVIDLARNYGQQIALTAGLQHAKGDYIFILDADLQDPPELLVPMLEKMDQGADVVYGQRLVREGETWFKKFTSYMFYYFLDYLSDTKIPRNVGDFRLMRRVVLDAVLSMPEHHRYMRGMISWVGFRQVPYHYKRDARHAGNTKYSLPKLMRIAIDAITSFSITPLRFSILLAFIGIGFAGIMGLYILYSYFFRDSLNGWASLAMLISIFSSLQLFCIGMIGEYVGRTYVQVKNRPLYFVRDVLPSHLNK